MKEETKDTSVQFMLAEFSRIESAESFNREAGEGRVRLYLTILSFSVAALVTLWQFVESTEIKSLTEFFLTAFIVCFFVSMIGRITFYLLIQRWVLSIIFLRKLARIRYWFVEKDPEMLNSLVYAIDDTKPSFISSSFFSSSLFSLVVILNCTVFSATCVFFILAIGTNYFHKQEYWLMSIFLFGVSIGVITWFIMKSIVFNKLSKMESSKSAAFPCKQKLEKRTEINEQS